MGSASLRQMLYIYRVGGGRYEGATPVWPYIFVLTSSSWAQLPGRCAALPGLAPWGASVPCGDEVEDSFQVTPKQAIPTLTRARLVAVRVVRFTAYQTGPKSLTIPLTPPLHTQAVSDSHSDTFHGPSLLRRRQLTLLCEHKQWNRD